MATMIDYIKWRGDLSFEERPFNPVDNLVLSTLAYFDLGLALPATLSQPMPLASVCEKLVNASKHTSVVKCVADLSVELLEAVAASRRYSSMSISMHREVFSPRQALQFAAFAFSCPDFHYVAFRGTDTSIVGWRENFEATFTVTAAMRSAVEFVTEVARVLAPEAADGDSAQPPLYVGGHSKGGLLAAYGVAQAPRAVCERVAQVFSNDGPDMDPRLTKHRLAATLREKLRCYVPEYSIVGMLQRDDAAHRVIVKSSARGIMQHDATTWQVTADDFVRAEAIAPEAAKVNEVIAEWTDSLVAGDRAYLCAAVFDSLEACGVRTFGEIWQSPRSIRRFLESRAWVDPRVRELLGRLMSLSISAALPWRG